MVGYDLISGTGPACVMGTILLTASFFLLSLVQYWYHGMGVESNQDWNALPVVSWVNINGKWEQVESKGAYGDYYGKLDYEYKWVIGKASMGFVQNDPPTECTVLCSPGMRLAVDKILKDIPKEQYN